jgi:hypothetical protein
MTINDLGRQVGKTFPLGGASTTIASILGPDCPSPGRKWTASSSTAIGFGAAGQLGVLPGATAARNHLNHAARNLTPTDDSRAG